MTPFSSVAILEKLALLKIAFCKAPVFRRASLRRTSATTSTAPEASAMAGSFGPYGHIHPLGASGRQLASSSGPFYSMRESRTFACAVVHTSSRRPTIVRADSNVSRARRTKVRPSTRRTHPSPKCLQNEARAFWPIIQEPIAAWSACPAATLCAVQKGVPMVRSVWFVSVLTSVVLAAPMIGYAHF